MGKMTQEEINVDLFDEVKRLKNKINCIKIKKTNLLESLEDRKDEFIDDEFYENLLLDIDNINKDLSR